jgi:teichuronic acid biosynthesis glycosyltransferase TuaC
MNILFLSSVFPNAIDESRGCFNLSLVRALAIAHRVEVVSPIPWIDLVKGHRRGIQVPMSERIADPAGFGMHYVPFLYPPKVLRRWYGAFYWSSIARTVRSLIQTHRPELIISYWAHPDGEGAVRIGRLVGAPSCVIIGGSDVLLMPRDPSRRRRVQWVLNATDAVITVNDHLQKAVVRLGIPADKVHVWHQGIDVGRFQRGDRNLARQQIGITAPGRVIVWVGRMVPVKGLDILLKSCVMLRDRGVEYHLYLVGEGLLREELMAQTEAHDLVTHITFVGPRAHDELPDWYRAADLTVLPSRSEGLPNVLRESLACGTPFVASNVGGISEIADPDSSLLVPSEEPSSLADAIAQALDRWGGNGSASPPGFQSWEESANTLVEIMQQYVTCGPFVRTTKYATIRLCTNRIDGMNSNQQALGTLDDTVSQGSTISYGAGDWGEFDIEDYPVSSWVRQAIRWGLSATLPSRLFFTHGPRQGRSVCLTFDDGPDPLFTPALLDVLRDCGVRATFFVIGEKVERHPEIVRRIVAEGHRVGNHSFHHKDPASTSARDLIDEVHQTEELIARFQRSDVALFRPPHGRLTASKLWRLWMARQSVVLWNVDPKDYLCHNPSQVLDWFSNRPLERGDVVLFHDRVPHAIAVLPSLIEEARARGLEFTIPLS